MSPERSPLIEELSKLRQDAQDAAREQASAARDAQRQQEKANRRQAQANAGHHAAMQQAAWEQTAAARATQTVVAEQLDSQRHFQYTMWLQTEAGQAFRAWEPDANWYIKACAPRYPRRQRAQTSLRRPLAVIVSPVSNFLLWRGCVWSGFWV